MTSYLKTLLDGSAISGNTNLIAWQFEDVATSVPVQGTSPIEVDDWHWCHKITSVGIPRIGFHFNVGSYVATHWLTVAVPVKEKCCQLFLNCLFIRINLQNEFVTTAISTLRLLLFTMALGIRNASEKCVLVLLKIELEL